MATFVKLPSGRFLNLDHVTMFREGSGDIADDDGDEGVIDDPDRAALTAYLNSTAIDLTCRADDDQPTLFDKQA